MDSGLSKRHSQEAIPNPIKVMHENVFTNQHLSENWWSPQNLPILEYLNMIFPTNEKTGSVKDKNDKRRNHKMMLAGNIHIHWWVSQRERESVYSGHEHNHSVFVHCICIAALWRDMRTTTLTHVRDSSAWQFISFSSLPLF